MLCISYLLIPTLTWEASVSLTINITWDTLKITTFSLFLHFYTPLSPLISFQLHRKIKHKQRRIKVALSEKSFTMNSIFRYLSKVAGQKCCYTTKYQRVILMYSHNAIFALRFYGAKCAELQRGPSGNENGLRWRIIWEPHMIMQCFNMTLQSIIIFH